MPFQFTRTAIADVIVIDPQVIPDQRGFFMETYKRSDFTAVGITDVFVQCNHSKSAKGILRGLHYQMQPKAQGKLMRALGGEIYDVAVDIRKGSPTFGKWCGIHLSEENKRQLFIPEGFAHGFLVLSQDTDVIYKCSEIYFQEDEHGVIWSDPQIGVEWPAQDPILSDKDKSFSRLSEIPENLLPVYK